MLHFQNIVATRQGLREALKPVEPTYRLVRSFINFEVILVEVTGHYLGLTGKKFMFMLVLLRGCSIVMDQIYIFDSQLRKGDLLAADHKI